MTADGKHPRAAAYQRISKDRAGDEHGVDNQRADQLRIAAARGYDIVLDYSDNDISAYTGKHRPGFRAILDAARRGEIDVILVFQTSRFWRNRRERAEAIEILSKARVSIIATKGPSLDLSTAYGRAMAGLLGEFDTMESEVKAERQQFANEASAVAGKARRGCPQPFGWQADRITPDPAEAAAITSACAALLRGGSVTDIMRDWEARGVRPHQGAPAWTRTSVRQILRNPRNAGISAYNSVEVARGEWEPLVDDVTFREVTRILGDRTRQWPKGFTTLLGGLAYCRCGNHAGGSASAHGRLAYRCIQGTRGDRPGPHVQVIAAGVDEAVTALVIGRLSAPDAAAVLADTPAREDLAALRDEEAALCARLARLGELYAEGQISEQDLITGRARGEQRVAGIRMQLTRHDIDSVLAPLIAAPDTAAEWGRTSPARRRAAIDLLMTVTLYPSGRGARTFRHDVVLPPGRGIIWKA
jgi:DNA invertase Pin-like site-specific DNA recombinase